MNVMCRKCNDSGGNPRCSACGEVSFRLTRRKNYRKLSIGGFVDELTESINIFAANIEKLDFKDTSFPEWYELMGAWLEVDTSVEKETYSELELPKKIK